MSFTTMPSGSHRRQPRRHLHLAQRHRDQASAYLEDFLNIRNVLRTLYSTVKLGKVNLVSVRAL